MTKLFSVLIVLITVLCCFRVLPAPSGEPDWCEYKWPPDQPPPPRLNLPEWACKVVKSKKLNEKYTPAVHLNPFFLSGDFDGDHQTDIAILIRSKKSGESGILVILRKNLIVSVLGAGNFIEGRGGSNFDWMDMWTLYPKGEVKRSPFETYTPTLIGDAIWAAKSESASVIIFWNGKKYIWYQEMD